MTNDECLKNDEARMSSTLRLRPEGTKRNRKRVPRDWRADYLVIRHSCFLRHSSLDIRHSYFLVSILNSGCPNSTGWPFSTNTAATWPAISAWNSLYTFIASMIQTTGS